MAKYLVTRCSNCEQPVDAVRVDDTASARLGEIVQQAAKLNRPLRIQDQVDLGRCKCIVASPGSAGDDTDVGLASKKETKTAFRWTIRQMLYLTAIAGVFLVVFRNPVSLIFGVKNWAFVNSPWLIYRWLFFGIPMPAIKKGPPAGMDLFLFCLNVIIAVLVGFYAIRFAYLAIRYGWRKVSG